MTLEADSLPSKSSIFKIKTHVFPAASNFLGAWKRRGGFGVVDVEAVN